MLSKIYLCPVDKKYGCTWEGSSDDILEHFSQEHEELLFFTGTLDITLDATSENFLLFVDAEIYLLQTKINEEYLKVCLRYLGPSTLASKLTYDIDLSANGIKIGKQDIEIREGYFFIALECLRMSLGDVNMINCKLQIIEDSTSIGSSDDVFIDSEYVLGQSGSIEDMKINEKDGIRKDLVPDLQELLSTNKGSNSPFEVRNKKENSNENFRSTWHALVSSPKKRTCLNRSQTFTYEDTKKDNAFKRQASMRNLSSIAETDLGSELKCFICNGHLSPPIFLCDAGHNICSSCGRNCQSCSICGNRITAERNQELEETSANYLHSCINVKYGCPKILFYSEIRDHETNCTFCQYLCPMEECGYKSGYRDMTSHLNLIHSSVKMFQSFIAVFQKHQELFLVNEIMGIFYCSWNQVDSKVRWKAKFCGPKARKFFCELKFKGKNFKKPLLLIKFDDCYIKEMSIAELKEQKLKAKNSILTITR